MQTITEQQKKSLEDGIYSAMMGLNMIDDNGEPLSFGMGEMGEIREQAQSVVADWMQGNNITEV